jgi:glycine oxidase
MPPSDIVVIGAGIIGCSVAYELASRGARVRVVEARQVGQGATQASAGVLAPYIEGHEADPLLELGVRSLDMYDRYVANVSADAGRPIRYARCGTLQVATDEQSRSEIEWLARAATARGIGASLLDASAIRRSEPELAADVVAGVLIPAHGMVAAAEMAAALAAAAEARGAVIEPARSVRSVSQEGARLRVDTAAGPLTADAIVLAAGSWCGRIDIPAAAPLPVRPVRGQLLHLSLPANPLRHVVWGSECYLVPWDDGSLLVGATVEEAGFDERVTVAGVRDLLEAACDLVPLVWKASVKGLKVGLRPATPDGLPLIGPSKRVPNLFYASGHYRNGILLAPLTAAIVADYLLEGREDPALSVTSPGRFGEC